MAYLSRSYSSHRHLHLFLKIFSVLDRMGLLGKFFATGSTTYKRTGTKQKQGDSGLRLDPPRWAGNHYPTLVIEAGNTESFPQLHKDRDWWFDNSPPNLPQGDVKMVFLIMAFDVVMGSPLRGSNHTSPPLVSTRRTRQHQTAQLARCRPKPILG